MTDLEKVLGKTGARKFWDNVWRNVKILTGDVAYNTKGDLQTQINAVADTASTAKTTADAAKTAAEDAKVAAGEIVTDTTDKFDSTKDYAVGDYVIYDNKAWKFTTVHPAGAWDESHVEQTNILAEIAAQNKNFGALTEKLVVKYGTFTSSNNSIVQLQGAPNVVKYGNLVNVYFIVYLSIELHPGDILGDLSFIPRSELSNIPVYAVYYVTNVCAINLRYNNGHTHVEIGGTNAMKSGTYVVSFSYES